jgi:putative DNA primase/helicase
VVADFGELWRYEPSLGIWQSVPREEMARRIMEWAGATVAATHRPLNIQHKTVNGTIALALELVRDRCRDGFFAAAPAGIAVANGFVQFDTAGAMAFVPPSPEHRAIDRLPCNFESDAQAPAFRRFLANCFDGQPDAVARGAALQEFAGACLVGCAARMQRVLMLLGEGANGKSTFALILKALFPERFVQAIQPQDFASEYHRAKLAGVRLNLALDLAQRGLVNVSDAFKRIVSGDAQDARHPYGQPFLVQPIAGHLLSANELPEVADNTQGFWRRWIVVTFPNAVPAERRDPDLARKIVAGELSGVLRWALEGASSVLARQGYSPLPSSDAAIAEWRQGADPVAEFVAERLVKEDGGRLRASDVWQGFLHWCRDSAVSPPSQTIFGKRIKLLLRSFQSNGMHYCARWRG